MNGERRCVINPAGRKRLGSVTGMGAKQANAAILAAHRTFGEWREKTAHERAQMLKRWFEFVVQIPRTSRLVTCGQGKPHSKSRNEIRYAASFIEWFAGETKRVYADVIPAAAGPSDSSFESADWRLRADHAQA
ncbi:MAG: aldehyde dehydrogenase family protein [Burkholderiales bacterium]